MQQSAFCPVHGLFEIGSFPQDPKACPICGREGDAIHTVLKPALSLLMDPKISLESLIALRQVADCVSDGWITAERANTLVRAISVDLDGLFQSSDNGEVALALAKLIRNIVGNRSRSTVAS
jgi:hypothetical protein